MLLTLCFNDLVSDRKRRASESDGESIQFVVRLIDCDFSTNWADWNLGKRDTWVYFWKSEYPIKPIFFFGAMKILNKENPSLAPHAEKTAFPVSRKSSFNKQKMFYKKVIVVVMVA